MKLKIKYIFVILLFSLFLAEGAFCQTTPKEKFNKAVSDYSAGNFQDALKLWIDVYNTGYRSSSLDYNIGNAYFKINDIPNAILFYERAYLLNPSDEDINYNLEVARTLTVDRFQAIPELFFVKWYNFISLFLSANLWASVSLAGFFLCLIFLSAYIYSASYRLKVSGFWLALSFLILSVCSIAFSRHNKTLVYDSHKAIITTPLVSGKSSPDSSGTDLFVLHEGTKVTIGDEVGDWYEIRLSDGNKGWVPINSFNII